MKRAGTFFLGLMLWAMPFIARAAECYKFNKTLVSPSGGVCAPDYLTKLYAWAVGLAIFSASIGIMYAGYKYAMSKGNPSEINGAKETIVSIIVGLVLLLLSYTILQFLGVRIGTEATP